MTNITTIATLAGIALGVASLVNAAWQFRRSVHLNIFRTYADKYNLILTPNVYPKWQSALNGDQANWVELTPTMISYLNLIWEECYLARDRVIPRRLWCLWLPEIRQVLCSEFAQNIIETYHFHFPGSLSCGSSRLAAQIAVRDRQ